MQYKRGKVKYVYIFTVLFTFVTCSNIHTADFFKNYFLWTSVLLVLMSIHQVYAVLWRSKGRVGAPGTVVTDSSTKWILETESRSSADQPVFLTAGPCFQPHVYLITPL